MRLTEKQFKAIEKKIKANGGNSSIKPFSSTRSARLSSPSRHPMVTSEAGLQNRLRIFFPISPQPKERARTFVANSSERDIWAEALGDVQGKRIKMRTRTPEKTRNYEKAIKDITLASMLSAKLQPFSCPVMKFTIFRIDGDPDNWPTSIKDGDIDNLEKALCDGMNKVAYIDDRLVVGNFNIKVCSHAPGIEMLMRGATREDIRRLEEIIGGRGGI